MKRILLKKISLFVFVLMVANVRAQVSYTQQLSQYDQTLFTSGSGGMYDNGTTELGLWMNGDNSGNSFAGNVLWKNFRTGSATSNTLRSLQVGDEFTIQIATRGFFYGTIGVSLNSGSIPSSSWSNRTANRRIAIQQDGGNFGSGGGRGSWYYSNGATSGSFGITPNSVYADYVLKFKITAPNKCNVTVNGTTVYDVNLGGTADAPITHYSVYMSDDRSLAFNDNSGGRGDTYLKQTTQVLNTGTLDLGSSNGSFTLSNVLTNGLNANSTSTVSVNKLVKAGTGNLTLSGANTYTGNTEIDNGELWLQTGADIASGSSIYVGNGGQLGNVTKLFLAKSDGGFNFSRNININPGNTATRYIGGLNSSGTNTFSGDILRSSNQPLNIQEVTAGGNLTISGVINGSGTVTKEGNGTVTFTGANTYSGATTVSAGSLIVQKALYTATITTSGITVAFNSVPTAGAYAVLPGALSSAATLLSQPTGLGAGQVASFSGANATLTINDTPTVSLVSNDADNTFCAGTNVTFTATASNVGGGTVAYNFKVNGSSVQNTGANSYSTASLTNGQVVTVDITISGGTFLTSNTAASNSINNTVQALPASAGNNGTLTICSTTTLTTAMLYGALTGSPAPGGTWSPAPAGAGTYTYTQAATSPCAVNNTAQVVVTVQPAPASAGSNGTLSICSTTTLTTGLLYSALTGSPAAGGTWSPAPAGAGTYTYTQAATSPCAVNNTAQVVVTVQPAPASAGSNGTLTICSTTTLTTAMLYGALTGSPAPGGTWSPAPAGAGTYTYTQAATSPCTADNTATVVVSVQSTPASAGSNGTLTICSTTTLTTGLLYSALTGSPATGGTWSPAPAGAGTYTYTQTATSPCAVNNTAQVVVSVTTALVWYQDLDGDGYGNSAVSQTTCSNLSPAYRLVGGDCADNNSAINPGITEICYNNIDDNCSNTLSEGCTPVVVNMTPSYNNTTLVSLSTAIPAVTYSYPGTSNIKYRFSITNVTTGAAPVEITQASRYVTIPASLHLYGAAYDIKVSAVINEEVVPYIGNIIRVNAPTIQLVTLSSVNCGATLASLTSTLSANPGLNATGYTFRIRLNDTNPSPTYAFSQSGTRFVNANSFTGFPLKYSTSYKVSVQYTFTDPVTTLTVESGYGAECIVNTPGIPLISMASPTCGTQVATMNANISSQVGAYATGYQFRIRLFNDNGPTPTYYYTIPNASRFSSLAAFQGITLAYNTAYSISVQYSIVSGTSTVWSGYGPDCKVTTPFFPVTSLVPSQCGLTASTPLTQQLNITPYPGFPHYMVKLEEITGEDVTNSQEIEIAYSYFRLNQFSIAQEGKDYAVSVKIKLNGVFGDYDTACDLHTPQPNEGGNNGGGTIVKALLPFKATAYPNPFANNFMLDVRTSSQSNVTLKVYDMIGRLIEQRVVTVSDMETATIGDQYPTGVYNVVLSQEDSTETLKVIKR